MASLPTIASTTLEGGILELAFALQDLEKALTPPADRVQISVDADDQTATISIEMPVQFSTSSSGVTVAANPYT